jgi:succinate dehydrogenase / fumarate reductase flavoprotein subunit
MPVQPTAHYAMGGIPTNEFGEVLVDEQNTVMPGLFAAGEVACVSVHGANRLGTNSLLDLIVFGKHSGLKAADYANGANYKPLPQDPTDFTRQQMDAIINSKGNENAFQIAEEMKSVMFDHVSVFRTEDGMSQALKKVQELRERIKHVERPDTGHIFNTELLNIWELVCLLELAEVTTVSALARKESRGAHARDDFSERDDENWLKHTLAWMENGIVRLGYKPVDVSRFEPKKRVY